MIKYKPHIKMNSKKQSEKAISMKFVYGFPEVEEGNSLEEPDYTKMASDFQRSLTRFYSDLSIRTKNRTEKLNIPSHIDYIQILFQDQFDIVKYYEKWYKEFGMLGVNFSLFNHEGLFAVIDEAKFESFLQDIENFILKETGKDESAEYRGKIKFMQDFKLLTTNDILKSEKNSQLVNLHLIEFPLKSRDANEIFKILSQYLNERGLKSRLLDETGNLEVYEATNEELKEIVDNFDIVLSVTSSLSTVVQPTKLNLVKRTYGFSISNSEDHLPIIGILDTGISSETPLKSILINDDTFNLTSESPFIDNANNGYGHGTSVAALAAFGRMAYTRAYRGEIPSDAKLLSMKILHGDSGFISQQDILDQLKRAKDTYTECRLFVLTTCYSANKSTNEDYSAYAFELDKFSHENNWLIFISTANNNEATDQSEYSLEYFYHESCNICSPAESMNNITIGAAADNLKFGFFTGISNSKEFPALYSRKSHIDLTNFLPKNKQNKNLFKPDVLECGGDYEQHGALIGKDSRATMEVLSANPASGFYNDCGTSFSAPLVANIAARIMKTYPTIKSQTIKALIVNEASVKKIPFPRLVVKLQSKVVGHGLVDPVRSLSSNTSSITFIVEDEISPEEMKIFPLNFPSYLSNLNLGKKKALIEISATLCFSFLPILNNHLSYCPIQMAFSIFRNHSAEDIIRSENEENKGIHSKLRTGWSQNNRFRSKPVPASNTQKIRFCIGVDELEEENSTFKIAVHCFINSQLMPGAESKYYHPHAFSLAISISENLPADRQSNRLYSEMIAVNEVENIIHIEPEAESIIEIKR
jgi:Subtilase family